MKRNRMKLMSGLLAAAMLATMAACGTPASSSSAPAADAGTTPPAASEAPKADYSKTKLVIYSNSASDGRGEWLTEQAKAAGFNIEAISIPGGDLYNRVIAEKNNQIADIVFGLDPMEYERFKKEDLLLKHTPVWASEVDMTLGDPEGYYHPIVVQPLLLAYNKEVIKNAPKDWIDLATNEEYKGKYTIVGTWGGTSRKIIASMLLQYRDDNGLYGISDEGWNVMKSYLANGTMEVKGEDFYTAAINGTMPITAMWGSGFIQKNQAANTTVMDFVTPEIGVPYVTEQVVIFKNSKNIEAAKAFVDWFGSAELQGAWAQQFGSAPAHPEALKMAPAPVQDMMNRVKPQAMDWAFVGENLEKWMEKIELEYVK